MITRQWFAVGLVGLAFCLAYAAAQDDPTKEDGPAVDKRGGGRAFAGGFNGGYYPKRYYEPFYGYYNKRAGGRSYYPSGDMEKRGGARSFAGEYKRAGGRGFFPIEKRGGGRAFVGDWAAYPRMERRGGGRSFAGGWPDRYFDSGYFKRSANFWEYRPY